MRIDEGKFKTVHTKGLSRRQQWSLLHAIPDDALAHYFFEPDLIIRTDTASYKQVVFTLISRGIEWNVYPYPFPHKKNQFGQGRRGDAVTKYYEYFQSSFRLNCRLALKRDKRDDFKIFERSTHTMMNQFGYEWRDECKVYARLLYGRLGVMRRYEAKSLGEQLLIWGLMKLTRVVYKTVSKLL